MATSKRAGSAGNHAAVGSSDKEIQPSDKPVRWRRRPREDRRQSLIDATIQVVATHGITDCSLERVAAAAGVSHGLIRHYFGGKGALLVAAYQGLADKFLAALDDAVRTCDGDALARLGAYIDLVHDPFSLGEDHALAWFGLWYEARSNPEVHAINRKFQAEYLVYVENLVAAAAHECGVDVEPWRVARGLVSLTDGFWQELIIDQSAFGPEIAKQICTDFVARHFKLDCNA